jgi:hypothetical protein
VKKIILAVCLSLTLIACGGGSSSPPNSGTPNNPNTATKVGVFIDAPVKGLKYKASPSGKEGTTNADGEFNYIDGDTVSFSMGSIALGKAMPDKTNKVKVTQLEQALLVAQLLQVLDTDADENKIDISDIVIPEAVKKAIIDKLADKDGDASTSDVITSGQLVSIKEANPEQLTLQQRTEVIPKDKVLEHIEQQIGEPGLRFSASELANQLFFDASLLTEYMGSVFVLPSVTSNPAKWIVVDDGKATLSQQSWNVDDQGNLIFDLEMYIGDQGHTVNITCTLSKIAEGDYSIDVSVSCPVHGSEAINRGLSTILKPQPFSANDLSGKSFNFTSLNKENETLTFRNDGTYDCGDEANCTYKDADHKNAVWIHDGGDDPHEGTLLILAQGSLANGKWLAIYFSDEDKVEVTVVKVSGTTLREEFETADNDESSDHNNNTDDHSDSNDNPNSGTQNPNYIPFTQEMISGKTIYILITQDDSDDPFTKVTIQFDSSETGKYQFGYHDNVTSPYATFDYSIDNQGYLIFSNQVIDGSPMPDSIHGLFKKENTFLELCVAHSKELANECSVEVWFYNKNDAEAALENQ